MKRTLVMIGGLAAVAALGGCGGGDSGGNAAPSAPKPATQGSITADPCTALTAPQLNAYLAGGPQEPHRADRAADRVCQWGDGEFRLVELTLTRTPPAPGKPIAVGTRTGSTGAADDYGCTVAVATARGTARLQTVTTNTGVATCNATATTLAAAVTALGW